MQENKKSPQYLIAEVKDADTKKGIVTGYLASFGNLDADNDIIMQGAFTKSLTEMGPASVKPRIKYLLDHDTTKGLGVFNILKEDAKGLYYEAQVGSHNLGQDFLKMVDSGLITEHSIGYAVVKKSLINPDADWKDQQTQLQELKLYEGSALQCWGANPDTPLTGVKAQKYAEQRIPNLIKALKNGTFTEKTFDLLEKELIFLQKAISDYGTTEPELTEEATQPNDERKMLNVLKLMNANFEMRLSRFH
jgi:HK97 family phage prohead protease